jgi:hypothetical protein
MTTETIEPPPVTRVPNNNDPPPKEESLDVPKIVSAGLSGLAGGAVVAIVIVGGGIFAALAGSVVGAAITGVAEYSREKKQKAAH